MPSVSFLRRFTESTAFLPLHILTKMRKKSACVLQEQYVFVYDALLEALKAGKTVIGCSVFKPEFDKLCMVDATCGKSKLQQQFEASLVAAFYQLTCSFYSHIFRFCLNVTELFTVRYFGLHEGSVVVRIGSAPFPGWRTIPGFSMFCYKGSFSVCLLCLGCM